MNIHLLVLVIVLPTVLSFRIVNYCTIPSCSPGRHTLCRFNINDSSQENCGQIISSNLTLDERKNIIDLHNDFRRTVYGDDLDNSEPSVGNATLLEWDEELAKAAQAWVQQCPSEKDECRNVDRFRVNQNIGLRRSRTRIDDLKIEELITTWYTEMQTFNVPEMIPDNHSSYASLWITLNYNHMVWDNTIKIGCAQMKNFVREFYRLTLICNYGIKDSV